MKLENNFNKLVKRVTILLQFSIGLSILSCLLIVYYFIDPDLSAFHQESEITVATDINNIENGIHVRTGLIEGEGLMAVVNNCTTCHSSKLIIQNRMNTVSWDATIKWMQKTQNLWDLGEDHDLIINYLVTNYPPKSVGRRKGLSNIDWYLLEE